MSRLALPVLGLVSGCASIFDLDPIGKLPDAGAELDAQDASTGCYGGNGPNADFPPTCINPADTDAWSPPLTTLDTDSTTDCEIALGQLGGAQICLIVAETITLSTRLQVRGGRPLALLATRTLTIGTGGEVLVDSVTNGRRGPNGNPANQNCNAKNGTGVALVGGGGGGGGSFGSIGGGGGNGQLPDGPAGGAGSVPILPITSLRGGCAGGNGGNNGNSGGDGGGAVYLIAGIEIILDGAIINASGAGGLRGNAKSGGGGGGAGGMIMLDAPVITMSSSRLVAHGGGGGGGGGDLAGGDGTHADLTVANYPAPGGPGAVGGGAGGNGAAAGTAANGGTSGTFGGGGGGGGHGVIRLFTTSLTNTATTLSPGPL